MDVARTLFKDQGFHQTGINQIATLSGVRVAQLYRDFENKDAIIAAVSEEQLSSWLQVDALSTAIESHDRDAIWAWFETLGTREPSDCRLLLEILAEAGRNEQIAAICRRADQRAIAVFRKAIEALTSPCADDATVASTTQRILGLATAMPWWRIISPDRGCAAQMVAMVRHELDMLRS